MASELTEQVAEWCYEDERMGGWDAADSSLKICYRAKAAELIALITEACIDVVETERAAWESYFVASSRVRTFQTEGGIEAINRAIKAIRALSEVKE